MGDSSHQNAEQAQGRNENALQQQNTAPQFDEEYLRQGQFGLGNWRPRSLQRFASLWGFVGLYSPCALWLVTVIQYTRTQITSIERHFKINSFKSGLLMSSIDVGSICFVVLGSHFGKFCHIPRLLSISAAVAGVAVMSISLVQAYTPRTLPTSDDHPRLSSNWDESPTKRIRYLCWNWTLYAAFSGVEEENISVPNVTSPEFLAGYHRFLSDDDFDDDDGETMPWTYFWMMIFMFIAGAVMSYKIPLQTYYVEQNVKEKNQSGIYMGVMVTAMVFGSPVALFLGAAMNKKPVDLGDTDMPNDDQNWISAWWLGYVVIGLCSIASSIPVFFLPRHVIHKPEKKPTDANGDVPGNFGSAESELDSPCYRRCADDVTPLCADGKAKKRAKYVAPPPPPSAVVETPGGGGDLGGGVGGGTEVSLLEKVKGVGQLLTAVIGTLLGGFLITKFRLSRAAMFKLTFVTQFTALCLSVSFVFLGCDNHRIQGFNEFSR
ncbi:putative solute carrier organic anion transporter family member 1B7 [Aplysia californica]|uniref:Solute carrier organic anion transporter family member 1B7 n=1 Tax=Aplysia californica TaxID=6500 RepID=A0ABM0JMB2_APLCA|nr:putative solute carrier organic anion transporter family member 1B7 [Aplysia californica]